MQDRKINIIKTGRGIAGSRIALVYAPPKAPPGSMVALTDFLNEHEEIRAMPGYHGPNQNHVLRVSGIPNDAEFLKMLEQDFPEWQEKHELPIDQRVQIGQDACCQPLSDVDHFPHQSALKRMIKENANITAGLSYMTGSLGLLLAGWREPHRMPKHPKHDYFRTYSAGAYFAASAILVALSQKNDNPRDIYTILEEVYPSLQLSSDEQKQEMKAQVGSVSKFIRNHPWEISMLLNSSGAASHAFSCIKRNAKVETAAALATLTACFLSAVIPEKGGRSMLPTHRWFGDGDGRSLIERLDEFADHHANTSGWMHGVARAMDWVKENPLKLAASVQGAANVGYFTAGMRRKNYPLVGMSLAFATGNYAQSMASKGRGDGFDSVVTSMAHLIAADPMLKNASREEITQRIDALCEKLSDQREVVHNKEQMTRGTMERLKRVRMGKQLEGSDLATGFMSSEKHILMQSPFIDPDHVDRAIKSEEKTQQQGAAIG